MTEEMKEELKEENEMTVGLDGLPTELLVDVCLFLSVRQVHRLRLNRRLRDFVDGWAGLATVKSGRHPLLRTVDEGWGLGNMIAVDAEGRRWGRRVETGEISYYEWFYFDGREDGEQLQLTCWGKIFLLTTRAYVRGRYVKTTSQFDSALTSVVRNGMEVSSDLGSCAIRINSEVNCEWFFGTGEDKLGTMLNLSVQKVRIVTSWEKRFSVSISDSEEFSIDGSRVGDFNLRTDDGPHEITGFLDLLGPVQKARVTVSRDGRTVASVLIDGNSLNVGFEKDGWKQTEFRLPT